ncbi:MAG: hypothetical protein OIN86_14200 [Candidatus Methanoperedens sp.]|nr:hypothetical protein [Candidatus Methanoperedens sp.]CAG0969631.1 hypothetical protein METP1_01161 [Methanosarcinales archaeon]
MIKKVSNILQFPHNNPDYAYGSGNFTTNNISDIYIVNLCDNIKGRFIMVGFAPYVLGWLT